MLRPTIDQQVTFLYTRDLEMTAQFYEQTMGLPLVLDQGSCRIYRVGAGGYLGFCWREDALLQPEGLILTIVTGEVDRWHHYLQSRGIDFERPPTYNADYNIYQCFLRDPNGYLIEIQQFLDPAWPSP